MATMNSRSAVTITVVAISLFLFYLSSITLSAPPSQKQDVIETYGEQEVANKPQSGVKPVNNNSNNNSNNSNNNGVVEKDHPYDPDFKLTEGKTSLELDEFWVRWKKSLVKANYTKDSQLDTLFNECKVIDDCSAMTEKLECSTSWSHALLHNKIISVHETKKSLDGRKGGIHFTLEGGLDGYFKPPHPRGSQSRFLKEDFRAELFSFYLDRIVGFNRAPAMVDRTLDIDQLLSLVTDPSRAEDRQHILDMANIFGETVVDPATGKSKSIVRGAMIGWFFCPVRIIDDFPPPLNSSIGVDDPRGTILYTYCDKPSHCEERFAQWYGENGEMNVRHLLGSKKPSDVLKVANAVEWASHHMYLFLIGIVRLFSHFSHNIFYASSCRGEHCEEHDKNTPLFIAHIDNDRSVWLGPRDQHHLQLCDNICIFPKKIVNRLRIFEKEKTMTLGRRIQESAIAATGTNLNYPTSALKYVDASVSNLLSCVDYCISKHGEDLVLVDELSVKRG